MSFILTVRAFQIFLHPKSTTEPATALDHDLRMDLYLRLMSTHGRTDEEAGTAAGLPSRSQRVQGETVAHWWTDDCAYIKHYWLQ